MPAISVVMPVYNGGRYLAAAVESILGQTDPDFEFIILDDGSSDDSLKVLESFAARDRRIRLVAGGGNCGVTARLNEGLALARAPLIARMDADDVSLPERFAAQRAFLDANPDIALVGSRVTVIDLDGDALTEMGSVFDHDEIDDALIGRAGQPVYHPSVIYRKAVAEAVGGYDESYPAAQDLDFFLKMAERGRLANLPTPLLLYREHFSRMGFARIAEQERAIDRAIAAACDRRGLPGPVSDEKPRRRPETRAAAHRRWGWWALKAGHARTARKHALRAAMREPLKTETARLAFCALRGR